MIPIQKKSPVHIRKIHESMAFGRKIVTTDTYCGDPRTPKDWPAPWLAQVVDGKGVIAHNLCTKCIARVEVVA